MPVNHRTLSRLRFALVPAMFVAAALTLTAQQLDIPKKPADSKADPKAAPAPRELPGIRLPDGTYLWTGVGEGDERINLTPQEFQKLLDQLDQLKKQVAARKAVAPSGCAIRARVEKRGEALVAVVKLTLSFRTTAPQTPVALGGEEGVPRRRGTRRQVRQVAGARHRGGWLRGGDRVGRRPHPHA